MGYFGEANGEQAEIKREVRNFVGGSKGWIKIRGRNRGKGEEKGRERKDREERN